MTPEKLGPRRLPLSAERQIDGDRFHIDTMGMAYQIGDPVPAIPRAHFEHGYSLRADHRIKIDGAFPITQGTACNLDRFFHPLLIMCLQIAWQPMARHDMADDEFLGNGNEYDLATLHDGVTTHLDTRRALLETYRT